VEQHSLKTPNKNVVYNSRIQAVYQIRCLIDNKVYIGSSIDIYQRWHKHRYCLNENKHPNKRLQSSWNKYGEENHIFEILEETFSLGKQELFSVEQTYMDLANCFLIECGFNVHQKANSAIGYKHSDAVKRKLRDFHTGNTYNLGRKHSEEIKKRVSERLMGNQYRLGISHSEETKKEMSRTRKGKKHSEESCTKLRKPVQQFDNGRLINEFPSITVAAQTTKIQHGSISLCCNFKMMNAGGFQWRFKPKEQIDAG